MNQNMLIQKDSEDVTIVGSSSYTMPLSENIQSADLLLRTRVAKLFESLGSPFDTFATLTPCISDSSTFTFGSLIKVPTNVVSVFEQWKTDAWIPADFRTHGSVLRLATFGSSERISRQQEISVAELIADVRTSVDIPFRNRLTARLEVLVNTSEEEFPEQEPMSSRSLNDFLIFIRSVPNLNYPGVVMTYEGNIRAEWTKSRNKHFALEFLGDGDIRFVIFAPDPKETYKTNRVSGLSTLASVMEHALPYGVLDWIANRNDKAA